MIVPSTQAIVGVLPPEDAATPERRGRQDEDVDDRQLAQSCPHGVRELGDRLLLLLRRDRPAWEPSSRSRWPVRPRTQRPGPAVARGLRRGGARSPSDPRADPPPGGRQEPAPVHPLVLGQEPANLRQQLIVPSAGGASQASRPAGSIRTAASNSSPIRRQRSGVICPSRKTTKGSAAIFRGTFWGSKHRRH